MIPDGVVMIDGGCTRRKKEAELHRDKEENRQTTEEYMARIQQEADRKAHREWRRDQIRQGVKFP